MRPHPGFGSPSTCTTFVSFTRRTSLVLAAATVGIGRCIDEGEFGLDAVEVRIGARHEDEYSWRRSRVRDVGFTDAFSLVHTIMTQPGTPLGGRR